MYTWHTLDKTDHAVQPSLKLMQALIGDVIEAHLFSPNGPPHRLAKCMTPVIVKGDKAYDIEITVRLRKK